MLLDKLSFQSLPQDTFAIRLHQAADLLICPLHAAYQGRVYNVHYSNNTLEQVSQISADVYCCTLRIFALLASIALFPLVALGLTIKLALNYNQTIHQIWQKKSNSPCQINGNHYCGELFDYQAHGKGKLYKADKITLLYEGEFQKNLYHGKGITYCDGDKHCEANFKDGDPDDDNGILYTPNGSILYQGLLRKPT